MWFGISRLFSVALDRYDGVLHRRMGSCRGAYHLSTMVVGSHWNPRLGACVAFDAALGPVAVVVVRVVDSDDAGLCG